MSNFSMIDFSFQVEIRKNLPLILEKQINQLNSYHYYALFTNINNNLV